MGSGLFQFPYAEMSDWVMGSGPWHMRNSPILFRQWELDIRPVPNGDSVKPVWVRSNRPSKQSFEEGIDPPTKDIKL
ncbi:hypothetical protein LINPERHAP2_LOCUS19120 [Linum perenne]